MTNDFNENEQSLPSSDSLEELLADVGDAEERRKLTRAWNALGGLAAKEYEPPEPSGELQSVFSGGMNQEMSDDELDMLAAAGTPTPSKTWTGDDDPNVYMAGDDGEEIRGEGGGDFLWGGAGADIIDGGAGDDRIVAGAGDDRIIGGEGNDQMSGGAGGDVFVFDGPSGHDTITDFNPLEDSFEFNNIDQSTITMRYENGNTIITYGDNSENTITVQGVNLLADTDGSDGTFW